MDRDARFSKSFRACLRREGLKPVRLLPRSPNFNAHLERFFGSLKTECLHKLILFGETTTRKAVRAFVTHYHTERNHQGLENELIVPLVKPPDMVLRSKRPSVSVACFDRIDERPSSPVFRLRFPHRSRANRLGSCCALRSLRHAFSPPAYMSDSTSTQNRT